MSEPNITKEPVKRRDFLGIVAAGAFFAAIGASVIGMIRLPFPRSFPEPSLKYKIGRADAFILGEARVPEGRTVFVSRNADGVFAISAICTHLGCIVSKDEQGFICPCHGSAFDYQGELTAGPAPKGLAWFEISLAPDGQLMVDEAREVKPGTYFQV